MVCSRQCSAGSFLLVQHYAKSSPWPIAAGRMMEIWMQALSYWRLGKYSAKDTPSFSLWRMKVEGCFAAPAEERFRIAIVTEGEGELVMASLEKRYTGGTTVNGGRLTVRQRTKKSSRQATRTRRHMRIR